MINSYYNISAVSCADKCKDILIEDSRIEVKIDHSNMKKVSTIKIIKQGTMLFRKHKT